MIGLSSSARLVRQAFATVAGALAGVTFMVLASASIQFDETMAPKLSGLTNSWSGAAAGLGRKIMSFSL